MADDVSKAGHDLSWRRRTFYDGEYWPYSRRAERHRREQENDAALIAWALEYRRSH